MLEVLGEIICLTHEGMSNASPSRPSTARTARSAGSEAAVEKAIDAQGLTLLGFKPRERLKVHSNVGPAAFLEPSEKVAGSTRARARSRRSS